MAVYTNSGDTGETRLFFGGRVSKADPRCEAYGATDEAVSAMGLARSLSQDQRVKDILLRVQREVFIVGAELATDREEYEHLRANYPVITAGMVSWLERAIDDLEAETDWPDAFVVPGASAASSALDLARGMVRASERRVVGLHGQEPLANPEVLRYLNRLSDLLFVLARYEDRNLPFEFATGGRSEPE